MTSDTTAIVSPYLGLSSFEETDRELFHGREAETAELFQTVQRETLSVVFGMSGLGKSSLLRAGLFPNLRDAGLFPIVVRLTYKNQDLVEQVREAISREIKKHEIDAPLPKAPQTLWEYFHRTPFWDTRNRLLVPVVVLDQFEELFTLGARDAARESFITELADLIENRIPESVRKTGDADALPAGFETAKAKIVLSLREDYLARLEDLKDTIPSIARGRFRLRAMNGEQAMRAIRNPRTEKLIDVDVAEHVARFVSGASDQEPLDTLTVEPALLSLVCRQLDALRVRREEATISSDLLHGESGKILDDFYEQSISGLAPEVGAYLEEHLLTPDGHRTTVALSNITRLPGMDEAVPALVNRRILRIEERLGRPHVEIIHDVLTRVMVDRKERRQGEAARRRRSARRISIAVAATLLAASVVGVAFYVGARRRLDTDSAKQQAAVARERAEVAEQSSGTLVDEATQLIARGDTWSGGRLISVAYGIAGENRSRKLSMLAHRFTSIDDMLVGSFTLPPSELIRLTIANDGSRTFAAMANATVVVWDMTTGQQRTLTVPKKQKAARTGSGSAANLPPAGGAPRASAESGGTATEVDTETDTDATETEKLEAFAITQNGKYAAAKVGKNLRVWNVDSGDQVGVAELGCEARNDMSGLVRLEPVCNEHDLGPIIDLQISADGAWIIVVGQSAAELFHRTKDALVPAPVPAGGTAHCRLKPDDELYSYERSRLGFSAAFSGNSSVLAVGRGRSIDTWRLDGTAPTRIETICANAESLALDFGGTWLARRNDIERSRCYYETTKPCGFFLYVLRDDRWIGFSSQHIRAFDSHQAGVALEPSKIGFSRTDLAAHSSSPVRTSCDYDSYFLSQGTAVSASSCGYVVDDGKSVIAGVLPLGTTLAVAPLARVVADADDGTVRIWKLSRSLENVVQTTADATPLAKTSIAPGGVWSGTIAVARDGLTLAIGSSDTASDSREQIVDGKPPVLALFSTVESAEKTELVRTSGEMPQLLDKNGNHGVAYVDFDPAQERVYSLGRDGHVRIWRRSDGSKLLDLGNEQGRILAAGFTPDGSKIATGDHVGRLCAWNSATGQKLACSEPTNVALRRGAFAMTPAGAFITTDVKGTIRLWKLGAEAPIVVGNHALAVDRLEVDKTGKWLASASNDGTARLWDLTTCAASGCKESLRLEDPSGFDDVLLPSDNGTTWLIATPHDDRVVVVDLAKPAERHVLTTRNWASSVDVSRPGHLLLCEFGGTVEEWDLRTKRLSGRLLPSDDRAWCGAKYVGENRFITQFTNGEVALWSIDALARGLTGWSTMGGLSFDASGAIVGTPRLSSGARDVLVMSRDGNVTARVPAVSRAVVDDKAIIFGTPNGGIGVVDAAGNGALSSGTDYVASTIAASHGERLVVTWDLHYELAPSASVQAPVWRALPSSLPHGSVRDARLAAGSWIVAAAQDDSVTRYDATGHRNDTSTLKGAAHVVEADNGDGLLVVGDFDVATIGATGPPVVHKMMSGVYSRAAAWDVGASLLALASRNNVVEIRDLSTNKVLWSESKTFGTDKYYAQLIKFGTVGTQRVIALATEGYIGIYAVATGKLVQEFLEKTKQKGDVLDLWFLEDGNLLTHDDAARLVLWDSRTGKQLEMLQDINDVVLGPGNRFLVTRWGEMRYVTYKNKKLDLSDPHLDCGRYVYRIASSATGKLFAAASQPKNETDSAQLCLIDAATGRVVTTWSSKQTQITRLAFRRDDTALLSIADEPAPVLWEVPTGKQLQVFEHEDLLVAGFAKGTPYIVTADTSGKLRIYDARAGRMVAESTQPPGAVQVVSSGLIDETSGILTTTDARGVIVQIDLATGRRLREFSTQRREIRAIAVAPGGSTIAAAVGSEVQLWRNAPGLLVPVALPPITLDTGEVDGLSFSPDGRWLAAADGFSVENTEAEHGLLTLWDASDGSNLLRKDTPVRLTSVAWSNDAREVVVAGNAGYLQVVSFGLEQRPVEVVRKILERMAPRTTYHPTQSPRKPSTSGGGMIDI